MMYGVRMTIQEIQELHDQIKQSPEKIALTEEIDQIHIEQSRLRTKLAEAKQKDRDLFTKLGIQADQVNSALSPQITSDTESTGQTTVTIN